jgi:hypothetical protein
MQEWPGHNPWAQVHLDEHPCQKTDGIKQHIVEVKAEVQPRGLWRSNKTTLHFHSVAPPVTENGLIVLSPELVKALTKYFSTRKTMPHFDISVYDHWSPDAWELICQVFAVPHRYKEVRADSSPAYSAVLRTGGILCSVVTLLGNATRELTNRGVGPLMTATDAVLGAQQPVSDSSQDSTDNRRAPRVLRRLIARCRAPAPANTNCSNGPGNDDQQVDQLPSGLDQWLVGLFFLVYVLTYPVSFYCALVVAVLVVAIWLRQCLITLSLGSLESPDSHPQDSPSLPAEREWRE